MIVRFTLIAAAVMLLSGAAVAQQEMQPADEPMPERTYIQVEPVDAPPPAVRTQERSYRFGIAPQGAARTGAGSNLRLGRRAPDWTEAPPYTLVDVEPRPRRRLAPQGNARTGAPSNIRMTR